MMDSEMTGMQTQSEIPWPDYVGIKPQNAFKPDICDFIFALAAFVLGYLFSRWVLFAARGWGVTTFTTLYLLSVTAYLMKKGAFYKSRAAWFWLAVTWISGASYALWNNAGFASLRTLFLFCAAVYYVITASGSGIMGKTGNYLMIDGVNAVIILPFRNFVNQYVSFSITKKREGKRGIAFPIILGVALALFLTIWLIPLLKRADSGGFSIIMEFFADIFTFRADRILEIAVYSVCAIPVAAYLYGLVSGVAHKKGTDIIKPDSAKKAVAALRF